MLKLQNNKKEKIANCKCNVMLELQNKRYKVMQLQNNKEKEIVDYKCNVMPKLQNNKCNVMPKFRNNKNLEEITIVDAM
jgi:hypothetical protein